MKKYFIKAVSLIVSLVMTILLMPAVLAAGSDATLKELYFKDVVMLNEEFMPDTLSYSAYIPSVYKNGVSSCMTPELVAVPNDPNATIVITAPADMTCGNYQITVTAENGTTQLDYTIATQSKGINKCADNGIENAVPSEEEPKNLSTYTCNGAQLHIETEDVYLGNQSLKVETTSTYGSLWAQRDSGPYAYSQGIYLASEAVKLHKDEQMKSLSILRLISGKQVHEYEAGELQSEAGENGTVELFNDDGTKLEGVEYTLTEEWKRNYAIIHNNSSKPISYRPYYSNWSKTPTLLLDDYYFSELNATGISVTDDSGNDAFSYITGTDEEVTITLDSAVLNQFGNNIGFDAATYTYALKGAPAGITLADNVLTIPAGTTGSDFTVEVIADVSELNSVGQKKIKGSFPIFMLRADELAVLDRVILPDPLVTEPAFHANVTNYKIVVPVSEQEDFSFMASMPELVPVTSNGNRAEVVMPQTIDGGVITVNVASADNRHKRTYNFSLEVAGENYYGNCDVESSADGWGGAACTKTPTASEILKGTHALLLQRTGFGYAYPKFSGKTLYQGQKYLLSMSAKNPDGTELSSGYLQYWYLDSQVEKKADYGADGTALESNSFSGSTTAWQTNYATLVPTVNISDEVKIYFTDWGNFDKTDILLDGCFAGELVASDVEVTCENRAEATLVSGEEKEYILSSKIVNQLGNQAGFGGLVPTYSVVGNPTGIHVADGKVSIDSAAKPGTYEVVAAYDLSDFGTKQKSAKGTFTVNVLQSGLDLAHDGDSYMLTARYMNLSDEAIPASIYIAVYEKAEGNTYKLIQSEKKAVELAANALFEDTVTLTDPGMQGHEYLVKAFMWKQSDLMPLLPSAAYR